MNSKPKRSRLIVALAFLSLVLSLTSFATISHALFVDPTRVDISNLELAMTSLVKGMVGWILWGLAIPLLIAAALIARHKKTGRVCCYLALVGSLGSPCSSAAYYIKELRPSPKRLAAATRDGDVELARRIIHANVDVNEAPMQRLGFGTGMSRGEPPLATAIIHRQTEIVKLLIANGALVNRSRESDPIPLHLAIVYASPEIVELLLDSGAETVDGDWNAVESSINSAGDRVRDPVVAIEILELLVDHGAAVESDDLHWLAIERMHHLNYIRRLTALRQTARAAESNQMTDLLSAVVLGDEDTAIMLIEQQDLTRRQREQLLSAAAKFNDRKIVDHLINSGTRLNWPDYNRQYVPAPLNNAVTYGYLNLVTHLIQQGADVDAEYGSNNTPLNSAVESNNVDACKLLIEHGADVNAPADGVPPIIRAAYVGNLDIVKLLIDSGANPHAKAFGHTPMNDALARQHTEVVEYLRSLPRQRSE